MAKKLGLKTTNNLTPEAATKYFDTKNKITENKIKKLFRSIIADACALIPLIGAHISWRVSRGYKGKSFTPIFSKGLEQLLENSRKFASKPLFLGRVSDKANKNWGDIDVSTSTKKRKIALHYGIAQKLDVNGRLTSSPYNSETPTVVLFHPNLGGAEGLNYSAEIYRQKGYNTLAVTLGGYEGSPGVTTSEKSMYQDIEAVKIYLNI